MAGTSFAELDSLLAAVEPQVLETEERLRNALGRLTMGTRVLSHDAVDIKRDVNRGIAMQGVRMPFGVQGEGLVACSLSLPPPRVDQLSYKPWYQLPLSLYAAIVFRRWPRVCAS